MKDLDYTHTQFAFLKTFIFMCLYGYVRMYVCERQGWEERKGESKKERKRKSIGRKRRKSP